MGGEDSRQHVGGAQHLLCRFGLQETHVLFTETLRPLVFHLGSLTVGLRLVAGHSDDAAFGVVAVDAFGDADPGHLIDGVEHGPLEPDGLCHRGSSGVLFGAAGDHAFAPSTVASGGSEAAELPLDDQDGQIGVDLGQVVGGPQSAVSPADDGHVNFGRGVGTEGG